jgi:hypothetical protein
LQLSQLCARDAQFFYALGRLGREKLDAEIFHFICRDRVPLLFTLLLNIDDYFLILIKARTTPTR